MSDERMGGFEVLTAAHRKRQGYFVVVKRRRDQIVEIRRPAHPSDFLDSADVGKRMGVGRKRHFPQFGERGAVVHIEDVASRQHQEILPKRIVGNSRYSQIKNQLATCCPIQRSYLYGVLLAEPSESHGI